MRKHHEVEEEHWRPLPVYGAVPPILRSLHSAQLRQKQLFVNLIHLNLRHWDRSLTVRLEGEMFMILFIMIMTCGATCEGAR